MDKKLFLLDAFALIYRAHFAFINRPLINSKGMNVSAITGFTNTLWDILQKEKPTHIAVAFDLPGPTFRHEMYEPYKANRDEQPEDITLSLPYIRQIIEGFNIPIISQKGYEADDVIGTVAKQAEKEGFDVYMMTPDKDYAQLVSSNVFLYKPARMGNGVEILDEQKVLEKWQIQRIDQVIDVLGLQGDAVDNIPGVRGIGPKTAVKLLAQFDTIEGILENTDQLKGKQKERLEEGRDAALLSKTLATIDLNVPVKFDAEAYRVDPINKDILRPIFKELEFRTLANRILGNPQPVQMGLFGEQKTEVIAEKTSLIDQSIENTDHEYILVDGEAAIVDLCKKLMGKTIFCFDTETTALNANEAELVGIAFSYEKSHAYYVPIPADQEKAKKLVGLLKPALESTEIAKIGQNIKYDLLVLKYYDINVNGMLWDTMIMHYLLEPDKRHNLNYLSETYLSYKPEEISSLIGKKGKNQLSMRDIDVERVKEYAGEDADLTYQLYEILKSEMNDELLKLYRDIEAPLINVLTEIEYNGVSLDVPFLEAYSTQMETMINEVTHKIYDKAGLKTFNIDSPKQVGEVLFEKLEIPYRWRKTKTGQYSTNEEKLSELAKDHEIVSDILTYRQLAKLKSTYVDALPRLVNPKTGKIHSSFNQALAATGRLSSQNPNLQNIPIRTARGREIRKAFIPRGPGYIIMAADYSQIELRLVAEISKDESMLAAFEQGKDIHSATASKIYNVAISDVTKEQRYNAKTVNFSIIYGAGSTNLSKSLDIKRSEAKELIDQYFTEFPGLKTYMDTTVEMAREKGYVTTLKGRRRYLRDIDSRNGMMRSQAERLAINSPIQGTAADLIKIAMIEIQHELKKEGLKTKMISQVHDELIFDVFKDELEQVKSIVESGMKNAMPELRVPILVGMGEGQNWLEAH